MVRWHHLSVAKCILFRLKKDVATMLRSMLQYKYIVVRAERCSNTIELNWALQMQESQKLDLE